VKQGAFIWSLILEFFWKVRRRRRKRKRKRREECLGRGERGKKGTATCISPQSPSFLYPHRKGKKGEGA